MFAKPGQTFKTILYYILCLIRVILVFLPQTGYIHPDEHFQGPEIVYGDFLQLKIYEPWEFASEYPIRNIVYSYLITGLPSLMFKVFNINDWVPSSYIYLLLVMPRLLMCGLSFLHDFLLYKVCILMKRDHKIHLIMFASSYVTLVFLTRTFSNSLESLFFSIMVFLLYKFLDYKNKTFCNSQSFMNLSFKFGLCAAIGVFNRPTFLCYSAFPLLSYTFLLANSNIQKREIVKNLIALGLGGLSILLSFTAIDTLYYNRIHYSLENYHNIKVISTPVNFILYNTDNNNLYDHGHHPRWLHSIVNVPLLFSTIGLLVNLKSFICLYNFIKAPCLNHKNILYLAYVTPLFFLSLIPHQEARFVIPLLFPVVLLCRDVTHYKKAVSMIWLLQNVLAVIFFGFFHQGGVYTASNFIHSQIQDGNNYSVVFYKTYMPPRYLLGINQDREDIQVYDFGSVDNNTLDSLLTEKKMLFKPQFLFVVVPQEATNQVTNLPSIVSDYEFLKQKNIFPHLRTESMSDYLEVFNGNNINLHNIILTIKETLSISILLFKST